MKKIILPMLLGVGCCGIFYNVLADTTINSADVAQDSLHAISSCMHYKVTGLCFWLKCSWTGCHVNTTLKLDHYLPDAVVSVYTKPDNDPFLFGQTVLDPAFYQAGQAQLKQSTSFDMGFGDEHENNARDLSNRFHEVDIVGNPVVAILKNVQWLLPSAANAYQPYYSSLLDSYAWRFPAAERLYPGSLVPGLHEVGQWITNDWGPVYPRNAYVNEPEDVKAAAVNALRASTIITADDQPHLYQRLSNSCGDHCNADAVSENSPLTQYQMIYPNVENQCVVFGDPVLASSWESDAPEKGDDRYVWVLWRHYQGCVPGDGRYIGSMNF